MLNTLNVKCFFLTDWRANCPFDIYEDGITGILYKVLKTSPWVFWVGANAMVHIVWVTVLLSCQLYQVNLRIQVLAANEAGLTNMIRDCKWIFYCL